MRSRHAWRLVWVGALLGLCLGGCARPPDAAFPPTSQWQCFHGPQEAYSFWYPPGPWEARPMATRVVYDAMPVLVAFDIPSGVHWKDAGKDPLLGDLIVTCGPVWVSRALSEVYDFQATGYDDSLAGVVFRALPAVTPESFCELLDRSHFLKPLPRQLNGLAGSDLAIALELDGLHRADPRVVSCESRDSVVVFHETFKLNVGFPFPNPRTHCFGAIRFLRGPMSSVQVVMVGKAPSPGLLETMREMVRSFSNTENPPLPPWR